MNRTTTCGFCDRWDNVFSLSQNENKLMKSGITGPEGHELAHPEEVEAEAVFRACVFANQVSEKRL